MANANARNAVRCATVLYLMLMATLLKVNHAPQLPHAAVVVKEPSLAAKVENATALKTAVAMRAANAPRNAARRNESFFHLR